jgi:hypothetical protein
MKEQTKITTTIRIPTSNLDEMQKESAEIGISLNTYMLTAIHIGRKALNSGVTFQGDNPE